MKQVSWMIFLTLTSIACRQESVRPTDASQEVTAKNPEPPSQVLSPLNGCSAETVAAQHNVPKEPEIAAEVVRTFFAGETELIRNEKSVLLINFDNPQNPNLVCIVWDIGTLDDRPDFLTCRPVQKNPEEGKIKVSKNPTIYAVFRVDDVGRNTLDLFVDGDFDGDICDKEFVFMERRSLDTNTDAH